MSCYICENYVTWCSNVPEFLTDTEAINKLQLQISKINQDINNDLKLLVDTVKIFKDIRKEIIKKINFYHTVKCMKCSKCKRKLDEPSRKRAKIEFEPYDDDYYDFAIREILKLSCSQLDSLNKIEDCQQEIMNIYNMIGMENIKMEFCRVIKYLLSGHINDTMMHIGIYGPPGHGKTMIAKLIGKAFAKSGLLTENVFVKATRSELIGKFVGHTAVQTTQMFNKARGGVIFIDEIYSLGNPDLDGDYAKECIDTINELLSERTDTLCIIAGYYEDAEKCFFSYNQGLRSRFPFNFHIDKYSCDQLVMIFEKMCNDKNWLLEPGALLASDLEPYVENCLDNAGRDMENIMTKSIISYTENNFLQSNKAIKMLTRYDIMRGLELYLKNKKKNIVPPEPPVSMYT